MDFSHSFHDAAMCKALLQKLDAKLQEYGREIRFMEVCGTHTVSIFQSGLRYLLPAGLTHLSGPGCPVCVTHDAEIAAFLYLAEKENVILVTFGDLMRVPAPDGRSLKHAQANGARVQIVYSPLDALQIAKDNPHSEVVFLGVGFETTAPAIAGLILSAKKMEINNFSVFSCHKLVPPALKALMAANENDLPSDFPTDSRKTSGKTSRKLSDKVSDKASRTSPRTSPSTSSHNTPSHIDAFLLPGHVALILGIKPFEFIAKDYGYPAIIAGFEPADIIHALSSIIEQKIDGRAEVCNGYTRAVADVGSPPALAIMDKVFSVCDTNWRGLGLIPQSGLAIREDFANFDAKVRHNIQLIETKPLAGCKCGEVLSGKMAPPDCPLFGKICTPQNPTGPCMVSTEGSCAAWYNYQGIILD